jgi:Tfp pilus assembly protein PilV
MLMLGIGVAGVWGMTGALIRMNAYSLRVSRATMVANSKFEELRMGGYGSVAPGSDSETIYQRSWTVNQDGALGTKTVDLTVQWADEDGDTHALAFKTVISDG